MIELLWQPQCYAEALHSNGAIANPELAATLEAATSNTYSIRQDSAAYNFRRAGLLEGVFSTIFRIRSLVWMPFMAVLLSVISVMTQIPHVFGDVLRLFFRGVIADDQWTLNLVDDAVSFDPGPGYEELPGVGAAMLDNLSINVDHRGTFTTDAHGFMQHMTLWQRMAVPKAAAPDFDAASVGTLDWPPAHVATCTHTCTTLAHICIRAVIVLTHYPGRA